MTFEQLIHSLASKLQIEIENIGGAAAIEIDGTTVILQDAGDMLLLRADVGEMPPGDPAALFKAALEGNYLYQGTGGSTLALDPESGCLHLQHYNWLERLDPDSALDVLFRFENTLSAWKELLDAYRPNDVSSENGQAAMSSGYIHA